MAEKKFDYENTSVKLKGYKLENILNTKFVRLVSEEMPDARYVGLIMYSKFKDEKPISHISLMYENSKDNKNSVLTVDCESGEDLEKMLSILRKS